MLAIETSRLQVARKNYGKLDRKSTRLNSSHSQISYAVFCLKKKKIQISIDGMNITRNSIQDDKANITIRFHTASEYTIRNCYSKPAALYNNTILDTSVGVTD